MTLNIWTSPYTKISKSLSQSVLQFKTEIHGFHRIHVNDSFAIHYGIIENHALWNTETGSQTGKHFIKFVQKIVLQTIDQNPMNTFLDGRRANLGKRLNNIYKSKLKVLSTNSLRKCNDSLNNLYWVKDLTGDCVWGQASCSTSEHGENMFIAQSFRHYQLNF